MPGKVLFISETKVDALMVERVLSRVRGDVVKHVHYYDGVLDDAERDVPDLIIVDSAMGRIDALDLCRLLRAQPALHHIPILLWRVSVPRRIQESAAHVGIQGYLELVWAPQELLAARDAVLHGHTYFPLDEEAQ